MHVHVHGHAHGHHGHVELRAWGCRGKSRENDTPALICWRILCDICTVALVLDVACLSSNWGEKGRALTQFVWVHTIARDRQVWLHVL